MDLRKQLDEHQSCPNVRVRQRDRLQLCFTPNITLTRYVCNVDNGVPVGTVAAPDQTFSPGQSASYTPTFSNAALDPGSQPLSQQIAVVVNAQVSAGLYNSQASASYSELVHFPSQAC